MRNNQGFLPLHLAILECVGRCYDGDYDGHGGGKKNTITGQSPLSINLHCLIITVFVDNSYHDYIFMHINKKNYTLSYYNSMS